MSRTVWRGADAGHRAPRPGAGARAVRAALGLVVLGLAVALAGAGAAQAARLTDLRVGVHDDYTRVVLETDAAVDPDVRQTDDEIVLLLDAESGPRAVASSKSPHVESVRVTPSAGTGGSEVRIRLRRPVSLERFSLDGPPRLVLDLSPGAPQAAAAAPTETAAADEAGEATPEAAPSPPADAPAEAPAVDEAPEAAAAAQGERWSEGPEGSALVREDPTASEERELLEGGRMAATSPEPGAAEEAEEDVPGVAEAGPEGDALAAAEPPSDPMERDAVPPPSSRGGPLDFLPAPLDQPTTLAILAALLIGLFVLTRIRSRRSAEEERLSPFDSPDSPDSPDTLETAEAGGAAEGEPAPAAAAGSGTPPWAPAAGETGPEHASAGEEPSDDDELPAPMVRTTGSGAPASGAQPSMFDAPDASAAGAAGGLETPAGPVPGDAGAVGAPSGPGPANGAGAAAAESEAPAGPPGSGPELERRLGHLERRLEELLDEKERLERQVAAQTEELRVQRAAIARTQRVLRGMSRPDEEASEPVPR